MPPDYTKQEERWLCNALNAQVKWNWFVITRSKWIVALRVAVFGSSRTNYEIFVMIFGWLIILSIAVTNLLVKKQMQSRTTLVLNVAKQCCRNLIRSNRISPMSLAPMDTAPTLIQVNLLTWCAKLSGISSNARVNKAGFLIFNNCSG